MTRLTHLDEQGRAHMVDVGDKAVTTRIATAKGCVLMSGEALAAIIDGTVPKGDVLATARVAGIMAAKKTSEIIPLCHPIPITKVTIEIEPKVNEKTIEITATVRVDGKTGVEMEALTAVTATALTIYDMLKAIDKSMQIQDIRLTAKDGGRSGTYRAD